MGKDKTTVSKSIRDVELHPDAVTAMAGVVEDAKKQKLMTEAEVKEAFYNCFEADDNFAKGLNARGVDNRRSQLYALTFVSNNLGRKVSKPKYVVEFMPINIRDVVNVDDKTKERSRTISAFGQALIINPKTGAEYDEKFATIKAFDKDCSKIEHMEQFKTYHVEAVAKSVTADVVTLTVDDRCESATDGTRVLSDVEELMTSIFDITPIGNAHECPSEGKYGDYRLVEGLINFIFFPKNKTYAKMELTDLSVTLEELEKKKSAANLTCLINSDMVTGIGRESIIRLLGRIQVSDDEEWGEQTTLFFPIMAYPMLINAPDEPEIAPSDDVADAGDFFAKKDKEDVESGDFDEFFDGEKKKEEPEDETVNGEEEAEAAPEPAEEETAEEEVPLGEPIEEAPTKEDVKEEAPTKASPEDDTEKEAEDPYAIVHKHGCWPKDFGKPDGIIKGEKGFNKGCYACSLKEPEVYALCIQKSKE